MLSADAMDERIRRYRTAEVTLTVTDADGTPMADVEVTVRMVRQKFLFGCHIFNLNPESAAEKDRAYGEKLQGLLNFATLPFYWRSYERSEGHTRADHILKMAEWCKDRGIRTKGHPLVWTLEPAWLTGKTPAEGEALFWQRITREVEQFRGLIDTWDVLNEAVVGPDQAEARNAQTILRLYQRDGRGAVIERAFAVARKAGAEATLILNDFRTDEPYVGLLADALAAGVPIDAIGIQSHMHGEYWGAQKAWDVCERFARFEKPLHFTELTILSGESVGPIDWEDRRRTRWATSSEHEERQAERAAEFYRVLFSHPAVEAITWWDLSDEGAWMGAPAGLIHKDMTPKPAYLALRKLIREEWWTGPLTLKADRSGKVEFRGFLGEYVVESRDATADLQLTAPGELDLSIKLTNNP